MNRAQEPRLRGGSSVAGALYAPAGLVSERTGAFSRICLVRLTRMDFSSARAEAGSPSQIPKLYQLAASASKISPTAATSPSRL
jgi:hypothetical protein